MNIKLIYVFLKIFLQMKKILTNKYLIWLLKIIIVVAAWWYVYFKFTQITEDFTLIFSHKKLTFGVVVLLLILMVINWFLEIIKWKYLVDKINKISLFQSFKGVCVGMSLAFITPNRIGEIGGRGLILGKNYKKVIYATFLGSIMQFVTTILFSLLGFLLLVFCTDKYEHFSQAFNYFILVLVALVGIYVSISKHNKRLLFLKLIGKKVYLKVHRLHKLYSNRDFNVTLIISVLRYIVFSSQFALLLLVFIPDLSVISVIIGITLVYFFTTIIPTSLLGEIGIRGSVAMAVFGIFTTQELLVFQISLLIWLVNFVLPTIIGTIYLIQIKKGNFN